MEQNQVVAWECHNCGREFDTTDGGYCKFCNQLTCKTCFRNAELLDIIQLKVPKKQVCPVCLKTKEMDRS